MKPSIYIKGMHGLGDNLHQRAIIRELYPDYNIFLETSWPQIYHDFPDIKFISKGTKLRTQLKNQARNIGKFLSHGNFSRDMRMMTVSYSPNWVRKTGSVLKAMLVSSGTKETDFSLPVPKHWHENFKTNGKPILVYRPLIERKEWSGCFNRNPDIRAYEELFNSIDLSKYFVISIADIEDGQEWIVSNPIKADLEFHKGELSFESIASLFEQASLVYCSPGFSAVLSKAIGTPVITIFGGYENSSSFSYGNSPYLGIDTIAPCQCFSHVHPCVKTIDLMKAKKSIGEFIAYTSESKN